MTPEERFERIERHLEFLANNQGQLQAGLEKAIQQINQHTNQIGQLASAVSSLVQVVDQLGRRVDERLDRLAEAQKELTEAQKETNDRLNALIGVVERYFTNGKH